MSSTLRVILIGNPGVGKSTILNTLLGTTTFRSGISLGTGLTQATAAYSVGDVEYIDTPGLDDVRTRETAAEELSKALSSACETKLIFVVTLASGTVKPADVATIEAVVNAVEAEIGNISGKYTVIVNKLTTGEQHELDDDDNRKLLQNYFALKRDVSVHLALMPMLPEAIGADDAILQNREQFQKVVSEAPTMSFPPGVQVRVRVDKYDEVSGAMRNELDRLRMTVAEEEEKRNKKGFRGFLSEILGSSGDK